MKKSKTLIIIILSIIFIPLLCFFIYANIMTFGNSRMPIVEVPKELIEFEQKIVIETNGTASFYEIPKHEIESCHGLLELNIKTDTIAITKENLEKYVNGLSENILKILKNKKCIDSIIITVGIENERDMNGVLIEKRFSFPMKK